MSIGMASIAAPHGGLWDATLLEETTTVAQVQALEEPGSLGFRSMCCG